MGKTRVQKIVLDSYGSYLGVKKGCLSIRYKSGNVNKYPLFEKEIGEVVLQSGNMVSTGALACMGFWGIDCLIMTKKGRPVAMLKALDDDSHVETRLAQYRAFDNSKAFQIAKSFILGKIEGQNRVLEKYSLEAHGHWVEQSLDRVQPSDLRTVRRRLMAIESKCSRKYFQQIFLLFPKKLRPEARRTFKAYDGVNNIFNLAYEMLSWKVHRALINAKLEPYLGFLHSMQLPQ